MARSAGAGFFAVPHFFLLALIAASLAEFLLCAWAGGSPAIPGEVLFANGALTSFTLERGDYWRLVAAGFLHVNPAHLIMNMISLVILGPHLERRLGLSYFMLVYFVSLICAGVVSITLHPGGYLGVGASGAIYGIFAALFALWIMGEIDLPASFFAINFALNLMFSTRAPHIDWPAHFGGFAAGFISCALLVDLFERRNLLFLRCKFPEFVKLAALAFITGFTVWLWIAPPPPIAGFDHRLSLALGLALAYLFLRLLDFLLSKRRGLAACVIALAFANALAVFLVMRLSGAGFFLCAGGDLAAKLRQWLCLYADAVPIALAIGTLLATFVLGAAELRRGFGDKGFIAQGLVAERGRRTS